jgi:phenylacetate-CoA ligase
MAEGVANFSECKNGKLHVDEDFAAVEFISNSNGSGNKVIGTNFTNFATPLLRYEVGDIVDLDNESCDCGLPGRIVKCVDGRQEDYIILRNGARVGRMDHIFKDITSIREAQIYQNLPGIVIVRVVKSELYSDKDESMLYREFRKRVGDEAEVQIQYVDYIQRSSTGKLRFVVSEVPEGRLAGVI